MCTSGRLCRAPGLLPRLACRLHSLLQQAGHTHNHHQQWVPSQQPLACRGRCLPLVRPQCSRVGLTGVHACCMRHPCLSEECVPTTSHVAQLARAAPLPAFITTCTACHAFAAMLPSNLDIAVCHDHARVHTHCLHLGAPTGQLLLHPPACSAHTHTCTCSTEHDAVAFASYVNSTAHPYSTEDYAVAHTQGCIPVWPQRPGKVPC